MQKINYFSAPAGPVRFLFGLLLACLLLPAAAATPPMLGENLDGFYAREGNDDTPAKTAGNNIYLKFFPDRWVVLLFVPYPYARDVGAGQINRVFGAARDKTETPSFLRGDFGLLEEKATAQIERYGYHEDRILFECGALSACSIKIGENHIELIKPGVINEHIVRYNHVNPE